MSDDEGEKDQKRTGKGRDVSSSGEYTESEEEGDKIEDFEEVKVKEGGRSKKQGKIAGDLVDTGDKDGELCED
mgnify:CR=1 FL=1